ncbi:hypothetical protein V1L54_29365, partial [Streptomyces sp. TRM 70361]
TAAGAVGAAGRKIHAWLTAGGPAVPEFVRAVGRPHQHGGRVDPLRRVLLSGEAPALPCEIGPWARPLLGAYIGSGKRDQTSWNPAARLWPSVLPAHRELLALHLQPTFAAAADEELR